MLITIPDVLNATEVADARAALDAAQWVDGKVTAKFAVLSDQIWSFWFGTVAAVPALEEHHQ